MKLLRQATAIFLALFCLLFVLSCTKSESQPTVLEKSALLQKVPEGTFGFFVWDSSNEAFKKFNASAWSGGWINDYVEEIAAAKLGDQELSPPQIESLKNLYQNLYEDKAAPAIANGVVFLSMNKDHQTAGDDPFSIGSFGKIADHERVQKTLADFKADMNGKGFPVTEQNIGKGSGFQVSIPLIELTATSESFNSEEPSAELIRSDMSEFKLSSLEKLTLHFAYDQENLGVSTSLAHLQNLFQENAETKGFEDLKNSANYKRAMSKVSFDNSQLGYSFFDLSFKNFEVMESLLGLSDEEHTELFGNIKDIYPLESFVHTAGLDDGNYVMSYNLLASPKSDAQKEWAKVLNVKSPALAPSSLPGDTLVYLNFSGAMVNLWKDLALKSAETEEIMQYKKDLEILETVKNLSVSIAGASAASFYPEITIVAETSSPDQLISVLKKQVSKAATGSPMPLSDWQEKKLGDLDLSFLVSPLGIGVYLARMDNLVVAASSEGTLRKIVDVQNKKAGALQEKLNTLAKTTSPQPSFLSTYVDLAGIYKTLKALEGTIAMFTGGQDGFDMSGLQELEKMNSALYSCNYASEMLKCDFQAKL